MRKSVLLAVLLLGFTNHKVLASRQELIAKRSLGLGFTQAVQNIEIDHKTDLISAAVKVACDDSISLEGKAKALLSLARNGPIPALHTSVNPECPASTMSYLEKLEIHRQDCKNRADDLKSELAVLKNLLKEAELRNKNASHHFPQPPVQPQNTDSVPVEETNQPNQSAQANQSRQSNQAQQPRQAKQANQPKQEKSENSSFEDSSEIDQLRTKIKQLEEIIAEISGAATKPAVGTPVWLPLDSESYIHDDNLKTNPIIDTSVVNYHIKNLQDFRKNYIEGKLTGLALRRTQSLNDLEVGDLTTLDRVIEMRDQIRDGLNKLTQNKDDVLKNFDDMLDKASTDFASYEQEIAESSVVGLEDYTVLQNRYQSFIKSVNMDEYQEFLDEFDSKKRLVIDHAEKLLDDCVQEDRKKDKPTSGPGSSAYRYHIIIDMLELKYQHLALNQFDNTLNGPLMPHSPSCYLHQCTGNLGNFYIRQNFKSANDTNNGLDCLDPLQILKAKNPSDADSCNVIEKMLMMKRHINRWHKLNQKFDDTFIKDVESCYTNKNEKLLSNQAGQTIVSVLKAPNFLQESLVVHISKLAAFEGAVKDGLSVAHKEIWINAGKKELRDDLIELYQVYTGLMYYGKELYAKNPRIKEYHEE